MVVKNYAKSPKAPDAMYKVGIIMQEKGQADKAKAVFQQVIKQYPTSAAAKQAKKSRRRLTVRKMSPEVSRFDRFLGSFA